MSLKEILKTKAKSLVWRNTTGAQSHTCTPAADECVPSINNKCTITEKSFLNTLSFSQSCWGQKAYHFNNNGANTNRQVKRGQTFRLQLGTELTFWLQHNRRNKSQVGEGPGINQRRVV